MRSAASEARFDRSGHSTDKARSNAVALVSHSLPVVSTHTRERFPKNLSTPSF